MSEKENITFLAEKCLSEKGIEDVEQLLLDNKIDTAKAYVLGGIDSLWTKKQIDDDQASQAYQLLGVDPDEAARLRQSSKLWK